MVARHRKRRPSRLGRRIRRLRAHRGLTQRAVAAKARVSQGLVGQLEIGFTRDVVTAVAVRIAKALGVSVTELLK